VRQSFSIYLAGNIKKGKEDEHKEVWTPADQQLLQKNLPDLNLIFLDPSYRSDDLSDQVSVFGRDLFQVSSSQLVLVDGRAQKGLGVGAEMMFAKCHRIPVIVWLPRDSHYQRPWIQLLGQEVADWIHPFIFNLSDYLAPTLEDAALWIHNELLPGNVAIKGLECTQEAIAHYLATQLERDQAMQAFISR
jgi:hypothetical protein